MFFNTNNTVNFGQKLPVTKFYVQGKNNTTLRCITEGDIDKFTALSCETLQKGKVINSVHYKNKKGFDEETLGRIFDKFQAKTKEGIDFFNELMKAQLHKEG